jgi:hypothetical protein
MQAVNFYNEHFDVLKSVVATFHAESPVAVCESQTAFSEPKVAWHTFIVTLAGFQIASRSWKLLAFLCRSLWTFWKMQK